MTGDEHFGTVLWPLGEMVLYLISPLVLLKISVHHPRSWTLFQSPLAAGADEPILGRQHVPGAARQDGRP
jgi:hypothetical protein